MIMEIDMKIKSGFIDLVSDNNKLSVLIENENERNSMGFSVLYDFFAEKLFPSVSTLMPNMVYCYLIYPLRQLYPIDSDINAALAKLTTARPGGKKFSKCSKRFSWFRE